MFVSPMLGTGAVKGLVALFKALQSIVMCHILSGFLKGHTGLYMVGEFFL